jgi:hypothetical protein
MSGIASSGVMVMQMTLSATSARPAVGELVTMASIPTAPAAGRGEGVCSEDVSSAVDARGLEVAGGLNLGAPHANLRRPSPATPIVYGSSAGSGALSRSNPFGSSRIR